MGRGRSDAGLRDGRTAAPPLAAFDKDIVIFPFAFPCLHLASGFRINRMRRSIGRDHSPLYSLRPRPSHFCPDASHTPTRNSAISF